MLNEFREDLISGEWVLFSTRRAKKLRKKSKKKFYQSKDECPFEDPEASGQDVVATYNLDNPPAPTAPSKPAGEWWIKVITNKYPAVEPGTCEPIKKNGPFNTIEARGIHEVVITRDHDRGFLDFSMEEMAKTFFVFKDRYKTIADKKESCGKYIQIFHNFGAEAGASIYHPHSQIISTPILPPDILRSVSGSQKFYKENHKKVHEMLINYEIKEKKRIIFENNDFVVFCPFVSKYPYEVRIFPKVSSPNFELASDGILESLAEVMLMVLKKIDTALSHPDFNFFIHTAPIFEDGKINFEFYHWHIEIIPKVSVQAGFEISSGVTINVVDPDEAAKKLNHVKLD